MSGACEPAPSSGDESEDEQALTIVNEDAPLEQAYEVSSAHWGTSDGADLDEVSLGGESGVTLYVAFPLGAADVDSAVLELQPSEDTTYGAVQTIEVWDVTAFDTINARRLPGARFERSARQTVWQEHIRVDVSEMARAARGTLYLGIRAHGATPGWRVATPGALDPVRRPRLVVHSVAEADEGPSNNTESRGAETSMPSPAPSPQPPVERSLPR